MRALYRRSRGCTIRAVQSTVLLVTAIVEWVTNNKLKMKRCLSFLSPLLPAATQPVLGFQARLEFREEALV